MENRGNHFHRNNYKICEREGLDVTQPGVNLMRVTESEECTWGSHVSLPPLHCTFPLS